MPGSRGSEVGGSNARIPRGEVGGSDAWIPRGRGRGFRCLDPEGEREGFRCPDGERENSSFYSHEIVSLAGLRTSSDYKILKYSQFKKTYNIPIL